MLWIGGPLPTEPASVEDAFGDFAQRLRARNAAEVLPGGVGVGDVWPWVQAEPLLGEPARADRVVKAGELYRVSSGNQPRRVSRSRRNAGSEQPFTEIRDANRLNSALEGSTRCPSRRASR